MVITPSKAVIELPTMANWELLALLASQEFPKEDASSAVQDQRVITSGQETKPSIESTCERVGYRIGRFLGDVVQARQQFRSVQKVSSFNPATAPITATATPGNTSSVLTPQMLTCEWSPVSLVDYPKKYQVYVVVARILRRIKMFAAELLNDLRSAMVDVLKGRVAKFVLACIIGGVAAEVVLAGFGAFSLVTHGGIPRLADIIEQSIDLSSSIGEFVLGSVLSPHVAEIAITGLVILALILWRRWLIKRSRGAVDETS